MALLKYQDEKTKYGLVLGDSVKDGCPNGTKRKPKFNLKKKEHLKYLEIIYKYTCISDNIFRDSSWFFLLLESKIGFKNSIYQSQYECQTN